MSVSREDVWEALADQFLDTETRTWVPRTARMCLEAGLDPAAAFEVWAYEVTPAVFFNLCLVAGEWAGWDREWLCARIERCRVKPSKLGYLVYRVRALIAHESWLRIEECMNELLALPHADRTRREAEMTRELDLAVNPPGDHS